MSRTDFEKTTFNYLEVNRGRYLCLKHGGFCDAADDYSKFCPLCGENPSNRPWQLNPVDRILMVVNGLQKRSKRNVALLASLIGGIWVLRLVAEFGGGSENFAVSGHAQLLAYLAVIVLLLSLAMYGASMPHISTADKSSMMEKTLTEWESHLAKNLNGMECWHTWAGYFFGFGAILFALAMAFQMASIDDIRSLFTGSLPGQTGANPS